MFLYRARLRRVKVTSRFRFRVRVRVKVIVKVKTHNNSPSMILSVSLCLNLCAIDDSKQDALLWFGSFKSYPYVQQQLLLLGYRFLVSSFFVGLLVESSEIRLGTPLSLTEARAHWFFLDATNAFSSKFCFSSQVCVACEAIS